MTEETTNEQENTSEEVSTEDTDEKSEGDEETTPSPSNPIEEARQVRDELRKDIATFKVLKEAIDEEKVKNILSGKAEAGQPEPVKDVEEEAKKAAMSLLEGSGLNPFK
jgi:energy-converting hydrogenase A subunit M|tara:strand:- start:58 stop:384 length:327 start_codon:yes stop_codon:yes gene_type:complete